MYSYLWSSTCTGSCFLNNNNRNSHVIYRDALHSIDSGIYRCSVTDSAGNPGSNSTEIMVAGKIYYTIMIDSIITIVATLKVAT